MFARLLRCPCSRYQPRSNYESTSMSNLDGGYTEFLYDFILSEKNK